MGGETAGSIDAANFLGHRLFVVIGAVLILSFLLLMVVFRSLVLPLKAVIMNLLSVGAAYGVMVAVFQWGWAGSVIGIGEKGPIDPWIPVAMFVVLFGLSMDYEVFLLSRIREEWLRTRENSTAVADGLAVTGRIITAAAAIMFCVFASFVIKDPLHILKVFGLGLATAVLVDATLVRMVLVPSIMELLGPVNWWMPRWMDRSIPSIGIEVTPSPTRNPHPYPPERTRAGRMLGPHADGAGRAQRIAVDGHVRLPQPRARRAAGRHGRTSSGRTSRRSTTRCGRSSETSATASAISACRRRCRSSRPPCPGASPGTTCRSG